VAECISTLSHCELLWAVVHWCRLVPMRCPDGIIIARSGTAWGSTRSPVSALHWLPVPLLVHETVRSVSVALLRRVQYAVCSHPLAP
jgi:hypothetical protein